jgi:hypothetical protein
MVRMTPSPGRDQQGAGVQADAERWMVTLPAEIVDDGSPMSDART